MTKNNISVLPEEISSLEEKEIAPFKKEVTTLKDNVEENTKFINRLSSDAPKWISTEHYKKTLVNIDFSNNDVNNLVKRIPKHKWSLLFYKAANLKDKYWGKLNDVEAIQYSMKWWKESDLFLESCKAEDNLDNYNLLDTIYKVIDEWKDPLDGVPIPEDIVFFNDSINKCINDDGVLDFNKLPTDTQEVILSWIERKYRDILEELIINFLEKNPDASTDSLFDNRWIVKLYIKLYNIQHYGTASIDYESVLFGQNKAILKKYFDAELLKLWLKVDNVDSDILKELEERDRLNREENQRRLQKFKKRNKEINGKLKSNSKDTEGIWVNEGKSVDIDVQTASWVDIAVNAWLWKQLIRQYNDNDIIEDYQVDEDVFSVARERFIESHKDLQEYLTIKTVQKLYNHNNSIKSLSDSAWDWLKNIFRDQPDELKKIYNQLLHFPNEITKTKEELYNNSKFLKSVQDEDKNNHAIGSLIDNVRSIFSKHQESIKWNLSNRWFKLNEEEPVKIEWENLIIFWEFNWANIIVRYNLKSGEIFMNSFLQYSGNSNIILWNDSVANHKVWQLTSFDNILSNNESLDYQMDLLSDIVVEDSEKQGTKNSIIINFMKTFNILSDTQEIVNIEISDWSNLFDFLQIIENSDSNDLEKFQIFMEKAMEYSWLIWWKNNLRGSQENKSTTVTFNENNKNKYISLLRDNAKSFSANPNIFKDKTNFDSNSNIWFAKMIIENITNNASKPNRKLDEGKMRDFFVNAWLDSPF